MSLEFLITSLIVVVAPGTGVIYTLSVGLSRGTRASVMAALGCTVGIVPHMLAAIVGLAALLHASAVAFQAFKAVGLAYLLYLAWRTLRERGSLAVEPSLDRRGAWEIVSRGFLINILNPKLSIFFLAFLPQFVAPEAAAPMLTMAGLSLVFMVMTMVVFVGYGSFAGAVRRHVTDRPSAMTWLRRAFAGAFVGLGVKLALAER